MKEQILLKLFERKAAVELERHFAGPHTLPGGM